MIIVTGTGRSGTTFVTQCLIDIGVDMGSNFPIPQRGSPTGCLEDIYFRSLHVGREAGKVTKQQHHKAIEGVKSSKRGLWGFKDPRAAHYLGEYVKYNPLVINCYRRADDVARSINKHYGTAYAPAMAETLSRLNAIDSVDDVKMLTISFDTEQTAENVKQKLTSFIEQYGLA